MSAFTSRESRDLDGWLMSLPGRELPPSFSESFFASSAEMERFNNSDAYARNRWDVVQQQVDRFRDLTGEALPNPENIMGPQYDADRARQYQHVRERFDTYRQQHPDADLTFPDDDALHRSAVGMMTKAKADNRALDQQREAAGGSAAAWWGSALGTVWGGLKDPINLASMALGAPAGAGILRTMLMEGAANMGAQAVVEAGTFGIKREADPTHSVKDALLSVEMAGIGGAAIGGGIAGLSIAARKMFGKAPVPREAQDAMNVLDRQQEVAASSPLPPTVAGDIAHAQALGKAATDIEAGRPVDVSEEIAPAFEPPTVENGGLVALDPRTVGVDAETFQYKAGGDGAGVTDRLRGVTEWRPERAGVSIVYERADGTRVVADGHQRRGLALRILEQGDGQEPRLNSVIYREVDGATPEQVRALAAAKNIAEGTGSPLDAAKVLRDGDPDIVRSLPPTSALVRDAKGLAQLDREPFGMVVNGVVPEQYGAIVGRLVSDAPMQRGVMGLLAKLEPANRTEAEAIVRQAMEAGAAERAASSQGSLFGDEVVQESLFLERARVLDRALKVLRRDRSVFGTLTAEADRITGAGNILDTATNLARADADGAAIQTLTTLANRKGDLSDALSAAARRAREEGRYDAAVRDFVDAARHGAGARPLPPDGPAVEGIRGLIQRTVGNGADRAKRGKQEWTEVGRASTAQAGQIADVLRAQGREIEPAVIDGARMVLDEDAVRHILKQHGDPKAEAARGQIAVTPDDFERLPEILGDGARIGEAPKVGKNAGRDDVVLFERDLGDAYYVVAAVRTGNVKNKGGPRLQVTSMYKRAGSGGGPDGAPMLPFGPEELNVRNGATAAATDPNVGLFGALAKPVEEVAAAPATQDALFQQVNRVMADRVLKGEDLEVPWSVARDQDSGADVVVRRSAQDLMDEADRAINDAAMVAACAFGMTAA